MQDKKKTPSGEASPGAVISVCTNDYTNDGDHTQPGDVDFAALAEEAAVAEMEAQLDAPDVDVDDFLAEIEAYEAAEAVSPAEALGIAPLDTREPLPIACGRAAAHFVQTTCEDGHREDLLDLTYLTRELMGVCEQVRELYEAAIAAENADKDGKKKKQQVVRGFKDLPERAIIAAYAALYKPVRLDSDTGAGPLLHYVDDENDENCGIYVPTAGNFERFVYALSAVPPSTGKVEALLAALRAECPLVKQADERWVVMQNGVFDYKAQKLYQFSPDRIFLSKANVAYQPCQNPVIQRTDGSTWDIESCIMQLACGDDDVAALYWQILGAALRATEKWNKAIILYGPKGNNGKSTLLDLIRAMVGPKNCAVADLTALASTFGRGQLIPATGPSPQIVLAHENDTQYLQCVGAVKAMITQDIVTIEAKHKDAIALPWRGLVIQGLNELPRTKEQNGSIDRRFLIVPFMAQIIRPERWTNSMAADPAKILEDPYIIEDFILRREVLEYVAYRALTHTETPAYWYLSEPAASRELADQQKRDNNPVLAFWHEVEDAFSVWSFVPSEILYSMYREWLEQTNPSAKPVGLQAFAKTLKSHLEADPMASLWEWTAHAHSLQHLGIDEPLMDDFHKTSHEWCEWPSWQRVKPSLQRKRARGIIRR